MNNAPAFLSTFPLKASVSITTSDPNIVYNPMETAMPQDTAWGKKNRPIPSEIDPSTIQLPIASPMTSLYCFFLRTVKSTTSSGSDVPRNNMKKLIKYSEMCKAEEMNITD